MSERVLMMDCGDGIRRADRGSAGKGPVAKTTAYTVKAAETGTMFTNLGAIASVTFTLPVPKPGMWFTFVKATAAQSIVLQMPAGVVINGGTVGKAYQNVTAENGVCTIVGASPTLYAVMSEKGTWANNNTLLSAEEEEAARKEKETEKVKEEDGKPEKSKDKENEKHRRSGD
jgi:hypothetical protein